VGGPAAGSAQIATPWRGMSVRDLSHPQEQPLTSAGSQRALAKTGACRQLGSRTADRMAVPVSPSIRERAWPRAA
jgi:hypothetical protein